MKHCLDRITWRWGVLVILCCFWAVHWGYAPVFGNSTQMQQRSTYTLAPGNALIGHPWEHAIQKGETLLDVARLYDLGFNEIELLHPDWDPWLPTVGAQVMIPSFWVLPDAGPAEIVINVAELRLYRFSKDRRRVTTFPIGIGEKDAVTPIGNFTISDKKENPSWSVPPSLRHKYDVRWFPPGPDNPLGDFWMGLNGTRYGIHGTDVPWSIGRLVTHGCIRLYPEDITVLFDQVAVGTQVNLIYQPVKIGPLNDRIFVEVHPDIYGRIGDLVSFGFALLHERGLVYRVDAKKMYRALKQQNGLPADVTRDPPLQAAEEGG